VTTKWDGAAEMIQDSQNGYVLDNPNDVAALADRVDRLRDATLRERLGRGAAAAADRLTMARHTSEVLSLYREMGSADSVRHGSKET
jgi:glycosyltransferase involved in cell wall biosynthesis